MAKFVFIEFLLNFLCKEVFDFEWDEGNSTKSLEKHGVTRLEAEELFYCNFIAPLGIQVIPKVDEDRYGLLSKTNSGDYLFCSFTIRSEKVRVISVRRMSEKEIGDYDYLCEEL